jgi:hypothetical protein
VTLRAGFAQRFASFRSSSLHFDRNHNFSLF